MSPNLSDKKAVMIAAISAPVLIPFGTYKQAHSYRLGCYGIRGRAKKASRKINPPADPAHDSTAWDGLGFNITQVESNRWVLWVGVPTLESLGIVGHDG